MTKMVAFIANAKDTYRTAMDSYRTAMDSYGTAIIKVKAK